MNKKLYLLAGVLTCLVVVSCSVLSGVTPTEEVITLPPATAGLAPVPAPQILSFHMLDSTRGWAVTEESVLRTLDGGRDWFDVTPPEVSQVGERISAYYLDHRHAWLLLPSDDYTDGTLYHTANGGETWQDTYVPFAGASLQFLDDETGYALADLGVGAGSMAVALYWTEDGGTTWTLRYINDPTSPQAEDSLPLSGLKTSFAVSDETHVWVGGDIPMADYTYLYASNDGGDTWSRKELTLPADRVEVFASVEEIVFLDPQEGYLVLGLVGELSENYIYQTTDGGESWQQVTGSIPRSFMFSILPGQVFICYGPDDTIFRIVDGDEALEIAPDPSFGDYLVGLQFVDESTGFALVFSRVYHRSFYVTHDGGENWTELIP